MNTLIPDVKVVLDADCVVREAKAANDLSDEAVKSWIGLPWAETLSGIDQSALTKLVHSSDIDGVTPIFHFNQQFPSGLVAPLEYLVFRSKENNELVAVGRDERVVANLQSRLASARQSMERDYWKIRELESRYRKLYEASSDPLLLLDTEHYQVIEANPAAVAALHLSGSDAENSSRVNLLDYISDEHRALVEATLKRARNDGTAPRVLIALGTSQESFMLRARMLEHELGDSIMVHLLAVSDNSMHLVGTADAADADREIFELAPDGIVVLGQQGLIVDANQSFLGLVEQTALDAVVGTPISQWLGSPGGDSKLLLDSLGLCNRIRQFPTTIKGSLGGKTRAEVSAVVKPGVGDQQIVCYVRDIGRRVDGADDAAMLLQFLREMSSQLGKSTLKKIVSNAVGLVERYYIEVALEAVVGNRTAAAKMLGVSRQGLYDKLARYGIDTSQDRE